MKPFFDLSLTKYKIVDWGYTEELTPETFQIYEDWVDKGLADPLHYLTDHRKNIRKSLSSFWPDAKSSICFLFSYSSEKFDIDDYLSKQVGWNQKKIAGFALGFNGDDYHFFVLQSLQEIAEELKKIFPRIEYKIAVDIHPVLDRDLAYRTGLGWYGKNSMLISKAHGSYVMIGSLLFNQGFDLPKQNIDTDHCGQCTRCIDACPTDAITNERTIVAAKCISTYTVEMFKEVNRPEGFDLNSPWIFGCDICQDVCPWNKRILRGHKPKIPTQKKLLDLLHFFLLTDIPTLIKNLKNLSKKQFVVLFSRTSFERLGKRGFLKNLI